ncbi:MAG TPA: deoxyribodipyrimidine photo-lyase [Blastocatellia bacterium]|nr:deoxyribodipyrimidine photo-lyase [Blastocatellia bacterium]
MKSIEGLLTNPRITVRREGVPHGDGSCVVYWMQRSQRGIDNPALDLAIDAANKLRLPVAVFFGLHPRYPGANLRHYSFLIDGLAETISAIEKRGAAFVFRPYPEHNLIRFCDEIRPSLVVGDENPLTAPEAWRQRAAARLRVPFWTVDSDVVVPTRLFQKEEYAARTLRPKITPLIEVFLQPSRNPKARFKWPDTHRPTGRLLDTNEVLSSLPFDRRVEAVSGFKGGTKEATSRLKVFIDERLPVYDKLRNSPHIDGTSELSAYLHFGHISPITIALAVRDSAVPDSAKTAFLEELIVRRELAINYVTRNSNYDRLEGCHSWARATLAERADDQRPYLYTQSQLESADTHDPLWNAAQIEMIKTGRMHGYVRMYWAKKILEWTPTPARAFEIAMTLNDRYFLDGRDPNGYTGIAWAIGGKHDRPWAPRRPIFGLIRYMSAAGMARKFDVRAYIEKVTRG